jgi:hypothetical protein
MGTHGRLLIWERPKAVPSRLPNQSWSSVRTCNSNASSLKAGTPTIDTDASALPSGAYDLETVEGKQQLFTSRPPAGFLDPSKYKMGVSSVIENKSVSPFVILFGVNSHP